MVRLLWTLAILSIATYLGILTVRGVTARAGAERTHEWLFAPPDAKRLMRVWPADGPVLERHENGVKRIEGQLVGGQFDGLWRLWWENGRLRWHGSYKDGRLDGYSESFYENGELELVATYEGGELHGPIEKHDEAGRLVQTGAYKHGRKHGAFVFYGPDGRIDPERSGLYDGHERIRDLPPERLLGQGLATKR